MTSPSSRPNSPNDAPGLNDQDTLSPEQARIVGRIRAVSMISAGVMGLAVMLVLSAIIYRVVKSEPKAGTGPETASAVGVRVGKGRNAGDVLASGAVTIPAAGEVVQTDVDGRNLAITVDHPGGTQIIIFDLIDWQVVGTINLR